MLLHKIGVSQYTTCFSLLWNMKQNYKKQNYIIKILVGVQLEQTKMVDLRHFHYYILYIQACKLGASNTNCMYVILHYFTHI